MLYIIIKEIGVNCELRRHSETNSYDFNGSVHLFCPDFRKEKIFMKD